MDPDGRSVGETGGPDVVIVGAGVYGLGAARRLADEDLRVEVLERQADVGGIWLSCGNRSSRVQNHEAAYRLGYKPASEDYTQRDNVLAELREAAVVAGLKDRIHFRREVVRVEEVEDGSAVRIFHRTPAAAGGEEAVLEELRAGAVIFCTGTLQRPLPGQAVFSGPVVDGIRDAAEALEYQGRHVVVVGMGAFAIESARTALLAGAARVDMVARHKTVVSTRLARVVNIMGQPEFNTHLERERTKWQPPAWHRPPPFDPSDLMLQPYLYCDARDAAPDAWQRRLNRGRRPNVWSADSGTPWTTSDFFFVAHWLGRLQVHVGEIDHLEADTVVIRHRKHGLQRLLADIVIKNCGFEHPEEGDCMGGICEVVGHREYMPPIWITPRILAFRHETDLPPLSEEQYKCGAELFNFVGSAPFGVTVQLEIYLHFRERPEMLKELLKSLATQAVALSKTTKLDISRGINAALSADENLRAKINARRRVVNEETWRQYAPPGTPTSALHDKWIGGLLSQNYADWMETCRMLTGDPHAVPYVWEHLLCRLCPPTSSL